nr:hypothetical protein [Tanacetum cinerariifolium]
MLTVTYVELFTHLRTYEEHALKSLKKKEQSSAVVDPLAYLAKTTPTHCTTSPVIVPTPQSSGDSQTMPFQRRASSNTGTKGIQTTGSGGTNGSSSSHINEVQISDDSIFSDVSYPLAQEMQQEEYLNSKVDSVLDDNMITYDEYQNDFGVEAVPTVVSADEADKQSMIAVLQRMHTKIAGYVRVNDEHKLVNATLTAELEWCKIEMQALERNKVKHDLDMAIVKRNKQNAELEEENVMLKSTLKSYSNPRYGKQARIAQPALYDGHVLLNPNHPPTRVHDSKESLVHVEVCKIKMAERPGHALPISYAKLNALYN